MGQSVSGVGVLDKSVALLDAVAAAGGACSLAELVAATGISRATAHRLAVALEAHGLLRRDDAARFALGPRLVGLGHAAAAGWPIAEVARPALLALRAETGESVQLYVRDGEHRVCVVSLESPHELRTIVTEGARLPLEVGSAGRILAGAAPAEGWTASVGERAPGVASVSAGVLLAGALVAAVGISGPVERLGTDPGARFGAAVAAAADQIAQAAAPT
ncbi:helix-turn-helix domain-containing protein [Aquihabitans sp. G128]|uniref:IclR family transcriptional regulator n=1 Tax=Aquihabitans sp. G128 TaxID=2849779 RepID=UPI001C22A02E|nr:helix-turn-helix domain-containing protein [Aquihabitans sp. G128]QXC63075.1 helix-turn-helix domain-containing protein [Aquihabitans sp. G128]